jgi:rhodanese-related sulfurtransferase
MTATTLKGTDVKTMADERNETRGAAPTAALDAENDAGGVIEVTPSDAHRAALEGNAVIVDVRESDEFRRERIDGAVNVPLSAMGAERVASAVEGREPDAVILHCQSGVRSADAAKRLLGDGWPAVRHIAGGLGAWKKAGLATTRDRRAPISVMRQVQITIGATVVAFTTLGAFVSPWALIVPAFFGAGLLFAGVTGWCGLAMVIAKLPWNRGPDCTASSGASCAA